MTRRVLRFCRRLLLALLILLALTGAAAWLWRLPLAGRLAVMLAEARGLPLALDVTAVELDHVAAEAIRVGGAEPITVASARIDFRLSDLAVDRVTLDGLNAAVAVDDGGLRVAALDGLGGGAGAAPPPLPPIRLNKARVAVATPQGTVELSGDATLTPGAEGQTVEARLAAALGGNRLAGQLSARRATDGRLSGRLRLDGGALAQGNIAATVARGTATFQWDPAHEPLPRGTADLSLPALRLRDVALGKTALHLRSDGQAAAADLETVAANGAQKLVAHLDLQDAAGPAPTAALTAALDLASFSPFAELPGHGRIEVDGFAALPALRALASLDDLPAEATIRVELADLEQAPLSQATVAATLHARTTASGAVELRLVAPAAVAGNTPEPLSVTLLPTDAPLARVDPTTRQVEGALRATVATTPGEATITADYAATPDGDGWQVRLPDAAASAEAIAVKDVTLTNLAATARNILLRLADGTVTVSAPAATLVAGRWAARGYDGALQAEATDLAWRPDGFGGRVRLGADVTGTAKVDATLDVTGSAEAIEARLADCARVSLPKLQVGDIAVSGGPAQLCARGDLPLLRQAGTLAVNARLRPSSWQIETSTTPLAVDLAALDLSAKLDGRRWSARAQGTGHRVIAEALQLAAEEIDLDATFDGKAGRAKLRVGRLADRKAAPRFAPLSVAADATLKGDTVDAQGTVTDPNKRASFSFQAHHSLADGKGGGRLVSEPPLAFAKGGLQPQQLLPLLKGMVTSVDGRLDIRADAAWGNGAMTSKATVEATAIGAQTPLAVLEGLNGKLAFASLVPPQTEPRQKLTLAKLDVGLPLTDGSAEITLRRDGKLDLHELGWPWAGGRIHVSDEVIDPKAEAIALTLRVDDVDLAELIRLLKNDSVKVTGRVDGTIPVEVRGDTVTIHHAQLASTGGGTIRYVSEGADAIMDKGGAGSELLVKALKDFRYDKLIVTLDGETTGNLDLAVQVRGANPELYDGYPFELNFSVGGALVEMLRQGLAGYRIPDNIVRELRGEPKP